MKGTSLDLARWARTVLKIAFVLLLVGAGLLMFAPDTWHGLDTGMIGGTLVPLAVLAGLVAFKYLSVPAESVMSLAEKSAMVSLAVSALATAYLFIRLHALGWNDPPDQFASNAVSVVIVMAIAGRIIINTLRRKEAGGALEDERDAAIRRQAASRAHTVLLILLIGFILGIGLPNHFLQLTSATGIAHALIFVILLAQVVRYSMEVWLHRSGRREHLSDS
jgi:Predicted membrane protein (DUF2178)